MEELKVKTIKGPNGLRKELIKAAKQVGVSCTGNKSKQRPISEIKFKNTDTNNRTLHEPAYYKDKSDEELVKDMFCCSKNAIITYSYSNSICWINNASRKINIMEELFVGIRAGKVVPLHNIDTCDDIHTANDRKWHIITREGMTMRLPSDSPYNKHVKSVRQVIQAEKESNLIFLDERLDWERESLLSFFIAIRL